MTQLVTPHQEDYEDLYENAPCGYLSITPDGVIVKSNTTFSKWLGIAGKDLVGRQFRDLLGLGSQIYYETHFAPLLVLQGYFNEVAVELVTNSGDRIPMLVNAARRTDDSGNHLMTRMTLFNASERRRYENELLKARDAAEAARREVHELNAKVQASLLDEQEASALREQFIAVLGHDLRNPLAAIESGLRLMQRTALESKAIAVATMVQGSITRMRDLIDNILDFARGRLGGGLVLEMHEAVSIEGIIDQVVSELQSAAPERVICREIAEIPLASCDPRRLGQLFSNLLCNALTHGAPGLPITFGAHSIGGDLVTYVANPGEPIPDVVMEHIFEPFYRGKVRSSMQGLGLGLYISHEIATAHEGTLEVTSTLTETRFTFRMPLHRVY
jgi:sigma-B regulation protein RsbU (phosphoserine phosphatase)